MNTHVQDEWQAIKEMLEGHAYHEEHTFHALLEKKGSTIHHEAHNDHELDILPFLKEGDSYGVQLRTN